MPSSNFYNGSASHVSVTGISYSAPTMLATVSIDSNKLSGFKEDALAVDFGNPYGIWLHHDNQCRGQLHASVTAAYLDDNTQQDLVVDFAPYGIWQWLNNQGWAKLHDLPAKHIVALPQ